MYAPNTSMLFHKTYNSPIKDCKYTSTIVDVHDYLPMIIKVNIKKKKKSPTMEGGFNLTTPHAMLNVIKWVNPIKCQPQSKV
jgi:hypothetical protein